MNPTTVHEAVNRYLDIRRQKVSANTYKNDRVAMTTMATALGPRLPLSALTRERFDTVFYGPDGIAHNTKASTFNAYLSRMRRFTQTATSYGWIDRDPLLGMEGRRRPTPPARQILQPTELLALVEAARSPRDRIALAIAVNTGLRANEIAGLRIGDVDLPRLTLHVLITKTGDEDWMPITADLARELRRWLTHYARHFELADSFYLVPQQNYNPHWGHEDRSMDYRLTPHKPLLQPYDVVKRALETLELPTDQEGFHTIRRSVGRAYYELMKREHGHESALVATAALLHHRDIRQTQHYIGVQPERLERDAILRGRPFLSTLTVDVTPLRVVQ